MMKVLSVTVTSPLMTRQPVKYMPSSGSFGVRVMSLPSFACFGSAVPEPTHTV